MTMTPQPLTQLGHQPPRPEFPDVSGVPGSQRASSRSSPSLPRSSLLISQRSRCQGGNSKLQERCQEGNKPFAELLEKVSTQVQALANAIGDLKKLHQSQLEQYEWQVADESCVVGPPTHVRYRPTTIRLSQGKRPTEREEKDVCLTASRRGNSMASDASFASTDPTPYTFREACCRGGLSQVRQMLAKGADPNTVFENFHCLEMDFESHLFFEMELCTGSPLSVAVLRGHMPAVKLLVGARADVNGEYSFHAGAEQLLWSGPVVHAAIPGGHLDLLKELLQLRADQHRLASNGASLVWQAAYFGKVDLLVYLLAQGVSMEDAASSQDDVTLSYTPLHAAARQGFTAAVQVLLDARAELNVDSGSHSPTAPLEDAILNGHAGVVELLVAHRGNLFQQQVQGRASMRSSRRMSFFSGRSRSGSLNRCLDTVFARRNPAIIAAVAEGLKSAPTLLNDLCGQDLVQFLNSHGNAPVNILQAIFRPHPVNYWVAVDDGKRRRMTRVAAYVNSEQMMNVAEGPHHTSIAEIFIKKKAAPDFLKDFVASLAPSTPFSRSIYLPVKLFMCHLPLVHQDLEVLRALANCKQDGIFELHGCQAIINLKWHLSARLGTYCFIVVAMVEVLLLEVIAVSLHLQEENPLVALLPPVSIAALVIWSLVVFLELARVLGYLSCGFLRQYLAHKWMWFLGSPVMGAVIIAVMLKGKEAKQYPVFGVALGIIIFSAWMRLLHSLEPVELIGKRLLPITITMREAGPFCVVLMVYLLGSTSMYFALGPYGPVDSFLILYRLVVLDDFDLFEMENIWAPKLILPPHDEMANQSEVDQLTPHPTTLYWPVRVLFLLFSFVIGVLLMNMFVAILCASYVQAAERSKLAFLRCRAFKVLDQHAMHVGFQCMCCRRYRSSAPGGFITASCSLAASGISAKDFIWYCRPREAQ